MNDHATLTERARSVFPDKEIRSILGIGDAIYQAVKTGTIVVLEEIQNASSSFQVCLQQCCDQLAYDCMENPKEWSGAGGLFMMGSLPSLVDRMFRNPLFQHVSDKISVFPFDSLEISELFYNLSITDPSLMLSVHTMLGGRPHPYKVCADAGLFRGNNTDRQSLVKKYFASELQSDFIDALSFYEEYYGKDFATAIKAVKSGTLKSDQVASTEKALGISTAEAFSLLHNQLYWEYGVIEPVFKPDDLNSIHHFEICDPLLILGANMKAQSLTAISKRNVSRNSAIDVHDFENLEGAHLEKWIKEIAEDRVILSKCPPFPFLNSNDMCLFAPRMAWDDVENVEIDVIAGQPSTNTLILASCWRSDSEIKHENLTNCFERLQTSKQSAHYPALVNFLNLTNDFSMKVVYYHIVTTESSPERKEQIMKSFGENIDNAHLVSLLELLSPFNQRVRGNSLSPLCSDSPKVRIKLSDGVQAGTSTSIATKISTLANCIAGPLGKGITFVSLTTMKVTMATAAVLAMAAIASTIFSHANRFAWSEYNEIRAKSQ